MKATLVETNRWCGYQRLRGFVLDTETGRLPGTITINLDNIESSIITELKRYSSEYYWSEKVDEKTRILHKGAWASVDSAEVESAIRAVV